MFFSIWWILIIDCMVEFKIVYGTERIIITVPVHIKKMHHTKMIYKIIDKPVPAETASTLSTDRVRYREGPAPPDAPNGTHGDENQTVASTFRYHERGHGPADHHGRGYDGNHPHGRLRDGDPSKLSSAHGARIEGALHKHYGDAVTGRGPHRHVDSYTTYGSNTNGASLHHPQHHVHGPRHRVRGHYATDVWYGKQAGDEEDVKHAVGDHVRGHSVQAMHGHFGSMLRTAGDHEHGDVRFSYLKPAHVGAHSHSHFGDYRHVRVGDHRHVGDSKNGWHFGRQNVKHFGGHSLGQFGDSAHGNFGSLWSAPDPTGPGFRGQNQGSRPTGHPEPQQHSDDLHRDAAKFGAIDTGGARDQYGHGVVDTVSPGPNAAYSYLGEYGFPKSLHDHQFGKPVYGHRDTGGYQVQENVADFNGLISIAIPPPHPATTSHAFQTGYNYPSPASGIGGSNTAMPPTVNNVYYTLDPVVPYDDIALRPQRRTARRRCVENMK
ncbi:uncharacterized protein LOC113552429 [Rhopalosiphum maidis]|uniref:uncharacterized protein LOC113552429 n=1 Tax=Rhopalosiphum maidis TaxID=43146 RepID=UPI000EFE9A84|nr:uncharacterized protein LOC113552429 [Rhopalosiphum maidis]